MKVPKKHTHGADGKPRGSIPHTNLDWARFAREARERAGVPGLRSAHAKRAA